MDLYSSLLHFNYYYFTLNPHEELVSNLLNIVLLMIMVMFLLDVSYQIDSYC